MDVQKRRPGPICLRSAVPPSERTLISKDLAPVNPRPGSSRRKQMLSKQLISPASAAASIKLELWPLRNPVSSIQPLIYADPPNVLTGNDRLNIHRFAAIHLAFLHKGAHRVCSNYPSCPATFSGPALMWTAISAKSLGLASNVRVPPPPHNYALPPVKI